MSYKRDNITVQYARNHVRDTEHAEIIEAMPEADQEILYKQMARLMNKCPNMGPQSAAELLFKLGRFLVRKERAI